MSNKKNIKISQIPLLSEEKKFMKLHGFYNQIHFNS